MSSPEFLLISRGDGSSSPEFRLSIKLNELKQSGRGQAVAPTRVYIDGSRFISRRTPTKRLPQCVGANLVRQYVIADENLNHVTGAAAAIARARRFFDEGF